jgi:hypothetical protein
MYSSGQQFGPDSYANQSLLYHTYGCRGRLSVCQLSLVTYVRLQLAPIFQTDYAISFVECIPRKTYLQHAVSSTTLMDFFFVITSLRK